MGIGRYSLREGIYRSFSLDLDVYWQDVCYLYVHDKRRFRVHNAPTAMSINEILNIGI